MTYTQEPKGLAFINNLNANSASSVVQNLCWLIGSLTLTRADYLLLTNSAELARQAGLFLAGILVGAWTAQKVAGVMDANNKRKANPEYAKVLEASERGKASGAAAALVLSDAASGKVAADPPVPEPAP